MESMTMNPELWERLKKEATTSNISPPFGVKVFTNCQMPLNAIITDDIESWSIWTPVGGELKKVMTIQKMQFMPFDFDDN